MAKSYTGGCACGAIRYEISAEPAMAGHCQCRDCQHATGTGHASVLVFPEVSAKITGSPKMHDVKADSGSTLSRGFCSNCGSRVLSRSTGFAGMVMVTASSLDDPSRFVPQFALYTSSGQPWDYLDPKLQRFAKMPPAG
jgi:hypothetical protein